MKEVRNFFWLVSNERKKGEKKDRARSGMTARLEVI
jgi:hypothetical protein